MVRRVPAQRVHLSFSEPVADPVPVHGYPVTDSEIIDSPGPVCRIVRHGAVRDRAVRHVTYGRTEGKPPSVVDQWLRLHGDPSG